jgi:tRNA-Thr(GGU) m(6)t(6)A37 methyltransferase TsaA
MEFTFPTIGIIHSCFKEKFGIPRQPGLAPLACGRLELLPPYDDPAALEGLETCSHLWLQFVFHANSRTQWKPKVKPPRLGGNKSLGVFATRSPVRPSPIGLSVVKLKGITRIQGKCWLELGGLDLLDGTPVLDIKPYVPYVDSVPDAYNLLAPSAPELIAVSFSPDAETQLQLRPETDLRDLLIQLLQQDPRPRYQTPEPDRIYGMDLLNLNVRWRYFLQTAQAIEHQIEVISIDPRAGN